MTTLRTAAQQDAELSAALGWPGGISEPVLDRGELLRMVATLAAASQWIACSERRPGGVGEVIAAWPDTGNPYLGYACVGTAIYFNGEWLSPVDHQPLRQDATHWMPLPAAPGSEK